MDTQADDICDKGFCHYYYKLPEKSNTTIRCFDRGDLYTVHGEDADLVAQEFFQSTAILRNYKYGSHSLKSIPIKKHNAENFFKHFLLRRQYRVEVYASKTKSGKDNEWSLSYKASPGNLCQFEDVLFGNSELSTELGVMALSTRNDNGTTMVAAAVCDQSERVLRVLEFADNEHLSNLETALIQINCRECLVPSGADKAALSAAKKVLTRSGLLVTEVKRGDFSASNINQDLQRLLRPPKGQEQVNASALPEMEKKSAIECLAAVLKFLNLTGDEGNFRKFKLSSLSVENFVKLDSTALKALNLVPGNNDTNRFQSVFGLLNNCRTPQGQRLLLQWLKQPLTDIRRIEERHDIVEAFVTDSNLRQSLHEEYLRKVPDLQRLAQRLLRSKANLQDAYKIFACVESLEKIYEAIEEHEGPLKAKLAAEFLGPLTDFIKDFAKFQQMISSTLDMHKVRQHEFLVKAEFDETLSDLKSRMDDCEEEIENQLQKAARSLDMEPGKAIKLESNAQLGFFFRVTKKDEKKLRQHPAFSVIDARNNGVRFRSSKLSDSNDAFLELKAEYNEHQKSIVEEIMKIAAGYSDSLLLLNGFFAQIDVLTAFSIVAVNAPGPYVRPKMLEMGSGKLVLKQARHPCLEMQEGVSFIPNDVHFERGSSSFVIITGPNMGGKSTYIRSVGVVALMAQIGCFVPCEEAAISVLDCVMARVGAADSFVKGVSTFLAEMIETSTILRNATSNSLVIIDELGRGTSTFDGFGLAWGISEFIAKELRAFCLFATHFHELTQLARELPEVRNRHVDAVVADDKLVLLYQVKDGVCDRSFGINVAMMAHFPRPVIEDARNQAREYEFYQVLTALEKEGEEEEEEGGPQAKKAKMSKEVILNQLEGFAQEFLNATDEAAVSVLRKKMAANAELAQLLK